MSTDEKVMNLLLSAVITAGMAIDRNGHLRSVLRRARSAQEVVGLEDADRFAQMLKKIWEYPRNVREGAGVAESCMVLIAQRNVQRVKSKDQEQEPQYWKTWVAVRLGEKNGEQRRLSEQRFQRLLRATDGDDRLQQMRRAIALLNAPPYVHPVAVVRAYLDLHSDSGRRRFAHAYFTGTSQVEPSNDVSANTI